MVNQITLFWEVPTHITAAVFRKAMSHCEVTLPDLLFWHPLASDHTATGEGTDLEEHPSQSNESDALAVLQRNRPNRTLRPYGPRSEEDLLCQDRIKDDAMPMIRFFHSRHRVGIVFLGEAMIEFANAHLPAILKAGKLATQGAPVRLHEEQISLSLNSSGSEWLIPAMTLKNPRFDFLPPLEFCQRIICQDIRRQARILGLTEPQGFFLTVQSIDHVGRHRVMAGSGAKKGSYPKIEGVRILSNLSFSGHWAAGGMISKGFGRVHRHAVSSKNAQAITDQAGGAQ